MRGLLLPLMLAATACGAPTPSPTPDDPLAAIEARLLAAPHAVDVVIRANGAVRAQFRGATAWDDVTVRLDYEGGFFCEGGAPWLLHDAEGTRGGSFPDAAAFERPPLPATREAVVIGLTRMGALHNLARLKVRQILPQLPRA